MAPTVPNPNWPTLFAEGNFGVNPYYASTLSASTDMAPRLYKGWSLRRGKQFELDQVQPGEFHGQWVNTDGALDPSNTTSAYYPGVIPYRGYTLRAQYPPSVNLLNGDVATGGEVTPLATGTSGTSMGMGGWNAFTVAASGTAWQGTQVWQATGTTGSSVLLYDQFSIPIIAVQGTPYTFSIHVRSVTTGANPTVYAGITWITATGTTVGSSNGGNVVLTGGPSASWTTLTFTANVPGPSGGNYPVAAIPFVSLSGTVAGTWSFQIDGIQWEQSSSASTFAIPGKNYSLYSGMIERYPQSWDFTGTYGLVNPVCVDTMALLSQTILKEAFVMDVAATSPTWFFPLNDAGGSTTFAEQAGRTPSAGLFSSGAGAGTVSPGTSITSAIPGGGFVGTNGPVVNFNNPVAGQGTVIDLTQAGITSPPSSGGWTRMIAFRTGATTAGACVAAATAGYNPLTTTGAGYSSNWYMITQGAGSLNLSVSTHTDSGVQAGVVHANVINDNNWHLAFFTMSSNGLTLSLYIDGATATTTVGTDMHAAGAVNESIGGDEYKYSGIVGLGTPNWVGDIALYAQWNSVISTPTMDNLYQSWKYAWSGDSSGARYSRILNWAGYRGTQAVDGGVTLNMGPANDIGGSDALTALQNVVNTESGRHFVSGSGAVAFQGRQQFLQTTTISWTFGENTGAGEIPYVDLTFDFDPTRISNAIAITQASTGQVYSANDTTSQANYGVRNFSRTNQSADSEEVRSSAFYYLSRYKDPHLRVQTIRIDVASNPSLWPSALSFGLGQLVRINRRDQSGVRPTITMDGFIEQVSHSADDKGSWVVDLQISPTPATPYGTFTTLRTTLAANATAGTNTITINALPDAATNPVRSELSALQLMLIQGGGNSELLAIAVGGVSNALAGYSTATVTFTGNLVNSYTTGALVAEASGQNLDSLAVFDTVQFAY